MSGICFVTTIDGPAALDWGLMVERIAVPMRLLCRPDMAEILRCRVSSSVEVVATDLPQPLLVSHKLALLRDTCRTAPAGTHACYWLDSELLYRHLSFEFLYSDLLTRAIERFAPAPAHFIMPGYDASAFFGGPKPAIEALIDAAGEPLAELFNPTHTRSAGAQFTPAFARERPPDLNLSLAAIIDEPILHIVGDSHVLNCFTANKVIGCRPNVLVRTTDMSPAGVPYAYQFSHHLGSRTMHAAGRPGALLTVASACGIKAGDAVVWVFGEIDVRCHVLRQCSEGSRTLDNVIDTLAVNYISAILEVQQAHEGLRSIVFAPIPPLDNPGYTSDEFPVYGSIEERIEANRQLRTTLASYCDRHRLAYLDVGAHFASARGDLRWELSDHFCHIASACQGPVIEGLYRLLAYDGAGTGDVSRPRSA